MILDIADWVKAHGPKSGEENLVISPEIVEVLLQKGTGLGWPNRKLLAVVKRFGDDKFVGVVDPLGRDSGRWSPNWRGQSELFTTLEAAKEWVEVQFDTQEAYVKEDDDIPF